MTPGTESWLSRRSAFEAQGVTLRYAARSWSGVRDLDGGVVLAIREAEVLSDDQGSSCLLWAPPGAAHWLDRASRQERLEHCRLAVLHGGADGLLVCGEAAEVRAGAVLALRVEKRHDQYWAHWGFAARTLAPRMRRTERRIAA